MASRIIRPRVCSGLIEAVFKNRVSTTGRILEPISNTTPKTTTTPTAAASDWRRRYPIISTIPNSGPIGNNNNNPISVSGNNLIPVSGGRRDMSTYLGVGSRVADDFVKQFSVYYLHALTFAQTMAIDWFQKLDYFDVQDVKLYSETALALIHAFQAIHPYRVALLSKLTDPISWFQIKKNKHHEDPVSKQWYLLESTPDRLKYVVYLFGVASDNHIRHAFIENHTKLGITSFVAHKGRLIPVTVNLDLPSEADFADAKVDTTFEEDKGIYMVDITGFTIQPSD